jgi:hypothetical protein
MPNNVEHPYRPEPVVQLSYPGRAQLGLMAAAILVLVGWCALEMNKVGRLEHRLDEMAAAQAAWLANFPPTSSHPLAMTDGLGVLHLEEAAAFNKEAHPTSGVILWVTDDGDYETLHLRGPGNGGDILFTLAKGGVRSASPTDLVMGPPFIPGQALNLSFQTQGGAQPSSPSP